MFEQGILDVKLESEKILAVMSSTVKETQTLLHGSEHRLHSVERQIRSLDGLHDQVAALNTGLAQAKAIEGAFQETQLFIERTLPTLIHLQMCEGLTVVAGHFLQDLQEFESKKLDEYLLYDKMSIGQQCEIAKFRKTVNRFAAKVQAKDKGMLPFAFGSTGDYWPGIDMTTPFKLGVAKEMYISTRGDRAERFFEELETERGKEMDKKI